MNNSAGLIIVQPRNPGVVPLVGTNGLCRSQAIKIFLSPPICFKIFAMSSKPSLAYLAKRNSPATLGLGSTAVLGCVPKAIEMSEKPTDRPHSNRGQRLRFPKTAHHVRLFYRNKRLSTPKPLHPERKWSLTSFVCNKRPAQVERFWPWHRHFHCLVIVSSRLRITLATVVQAASSPTSSLLSNLDSPTRSSLSAASGSRW